MKVLVTGVTGFIGGHYARHLLNRPEVEVYGCGREAQKGEYFRRLGGHFFCGDMLDLPYVKHICKQMDIIVHCAGKSGIWGDYAGYYQANVKSSENLLLACQQSGVSRLINLGTPSIYFDHKDHINIKEDYLPTRFIDNYARTKYQAESKLLAAHSDQLGVVSLRPRLVVGPGDNSFLPRIIRLHEQSKLTRVGNGRNVISVTSIHNLLQALDRCVFGPETGLGTAYNIADAEPVKIWPVLDQMMEMLQLPPVKHQVPNWLAMTLASAVERSYRALDFATEPPLMRTKVAALAKSFTLNIEKARRQLEYRPKNQFNEALQAFADYWQANRQSK
ncbi:MAG: NAD(P)-dependent oxidoreductase [Pseudomonadales bacterium]|nr:NAD(P)-dependent oxidoreductase [Pseudomonadales bacterium]